MKKNLTQIAFALVLTLLASACAKNGGQQAEFEGSPGPEVIGNPNAKGTVGFPPIQAVRARMYTVMGISVNNTALDTFITANRNTFNGTGDARTVTAEDIQKRVELSYLGCTAGIGERATNHFGPLFQGVNFAAAPSTLVTSKFVEIGVGMRKILTGQQETPAEVLKLIADFKTEYAATDTSNLMISLCSILASSPLALSVL